MTPTVFVLRPEPGLTATLVAAFERGIAAKGMPLARVEGVDWKAPAEAYDGLLAGSANVFRLGGPQLDKVRHLPVHAVGEATARSAIEAGFTVASVGEGGLQAVLKEKMGRLLRLAGEAHVDLHEMAGTAVDTQIVYRVRYLPITAAQAGLLHEGGAIMLHSGEMAQHVAAQFDDAKIDRSRIAVIALAPRIGELAGGGWREVRIAQARTDSAMLDSCAELWQG